MKTIWKYPIFDVGEFALKMPTGAGILSVQMQRGEPHLWALVDTDRPPEKRRFRVVGTGHQIEFSGAHLGTFQIDGGLLVFHLFEVLP